MSRSRIGPLALEGPLGKASSQVFRAIHVQQRMQVAVRIFATPVGMTPEAKREFAEEVELLKRLKHPNIIRCFGGGFDARDAYLVHELFIGQSLAEILERRPRLSWEMVMEYGLQLSQALQVAHEQGWFHGRMGPDKILVSADEQQLKLADFRREFIDDSINRSASLDQLVYRSPESFSPGYRWQASGDLYSMGAVLYQALTGHLPFSGGNPEQLRNQIVEQPLPPVASLVFDCPVWLSAIVEQLLDKNPSRRPFTAAATYKALKTAQENAFSGVGVAQHVTSGFSPLQLNTDREAAARALGIRKKSSKKKSAEDGTPLTDKPWFLVAGIIAAIGAIFWFTRPLSETTLKQRAEKLMAERSTEAYYQARDLYLNEMLVRFPNGQHAMWAQEQLDIVAMEEAERKMERNRRFNRPPSSEGERKYEEAQRFERFGDSVTAWERYRAIAELMKDELEEKPFVNLARKQAERLEQGSAENRDLKKFLASKLTEAETKYQAGDSVTAKEIWKSIVSLYNGNKELTEFVEKAQERLD
jgi:eukaryotic-like serine/threonine-protein kinase